MNQRELEDQREEAYEMLESELTTATSQLDQLNNRLNQVGELVESLESRYQELPREEQTAFAQTLSQVVNDIQGVSTASELLEYEEDLQEVYQNPILEAIQNQTLKFYEIIDLELITDEKAKVLPKIEASAASDPMEAYELINEITTKIEKLPSSARSAIQREVRSESPPISELQRLKKFVDYAQQQHETLMTIEQKFQAAQWAPPEFDDVGSWPELHQFKVEVTRVQTLVDEIGNMVISAPEGVPVSKVTRTHLEDRLGDLRDDPVAVLEDIDYALEIIEEKQTQLQNINSLLEVANPDSLDHRFLSNFIGLSKDPPGSVDILYDEIDNIISDYLDWRESIADRWHAQRQIIKTYQSKFGLEPPEDIAEQIEKPISVEKSVPETFSLLIRAEEWVESQQDDILDEVSEDAQELLQKLSAGNEVTVTKGNLDSLEELIELIDIRIKIDE